jgi:hypothetical protein
MELIEHEAVFRRDIGLPRRWELGNQRPIGIQTHHNKPQRPQPIQMRIHPKLVDETLSLSLPRRRMLNSYFELIAS